jgi:proteasome accessory factor C
VPTRDERTERTVDPMRLLLVDGRWYLEAWCRRVEGVRLFRLDRVDDVVVLDERAAPPPQAHERDVDHGIYQPEPGSPAVRLRLARHARWVADYYPVDSVAPVDDPPGGLAVTVRTADLAWARRLVASLGGAAQVDEPADLAAEVAADARAALSRYLADSQPASSDAG